MSEKPQLQDDEESKFNVWFFLGLFWCLLVPLCDYIVGQDILSQWKTSTYLETVGTITHSKVKVESDGEGTSWTPEIHYDYSVDGEQYSGEVYKFMPNATGRNYARRLVKEHPVSKDVLVYYCPEQPQQAVLFKGLEMRDAFIPIALIPFNGVALIMIYVLLSSRFKWFFRNEENWFRDFPIENNGLTIRLRTAPGDLIPSVIVGMSLAAFISIFLIFLLEDETVVLIACVAIIMGGLFGIWFAIRKKHSDTYVLVVDKLRCTLTLPRQPDKTPGSVVPFDSIEDLMYSKIVGESSDDVDVHTLTLHYRVEGETLSAIVVSTKHNWNLLNIGNAKKEFTELKDWILRAINREMPLAENRGFQ
jgi:hypothetical protein